MCNMCCLQLSRISSTGQTFNISWPKGKSPIKKFEISYASYSAMKM